MISKFTVALFFFTATITTKAQKINFRSSSFIQQPIQFTNSHFIYADPLVLVDGYETDMQSLVLDPKEIQSIDVIKDNTAKLLYGSKAEGGAIIIKTKPGTEFQNITNFVNPEKGLNSGITKIELNGVLLTDIKKLLIEKKATVSTMVSSDLKIDANCNLLSADMLFITTKFADSKE